MAKPGTLLETFDLEVPDEYRTIAAEIWLVVNPDGTEMLWHYEDGRHAFAHPARRCTNCAEVITSGQCGSRCTGCADQLHL
ncbi:hypothetical protein ACIQCV_15780 [Dietzia maris]|uniref:hypothetical protein n=1 Tax=Dietzia maris TaxID=37915 RepID=UPI00344FA63D